MFTLTDPGSGGKVSAAFWMPKDVCILHYVYIYDRAYCVVIRRVYNYSIVYNMAEWISCVSCIYSNKHIAFVFPVLVCWAYDYDVWINFVLITCCIRGAARIAQWLELRTRDRKIASSSSGSSGGRIFSRVNFLCWLLFRYPFLPALPQ